MSAMKTDIANCGGSDVSGEENDKDSENHDDHVLFAADAFAEILSCCCVLDNPTTHKRGSERKINTGDNKRNTLHKQPSRCSNRRFFCAQRRCQFLVKKQKKLGKLHRHFADFERFAR